MLVDELGCGLGENAEARHKLGGTEQKQGQAMHSSNSSKEIPGRAPLFGAEIWNFLKNEPCKPKSRW